jgi:hypothetical protein
VSVLLLLVGCDRLDRIGGGDDVSVEGIVGILVSPEDLVVPVGGEVRLTATGLYEDRTTRDVTAVVDWHSGDDDVAAVSEELDAEGLLAGGRAGETEVWAAIEGMESNVARVRVTEATLVGLSVEPAEVAVAEGDDVQLTALAAWSDGTRGDASAQVRWVTDDGAVAQIASGGVLTGAGEGQTTLHADWDGTLSPDVPVTVLAASADADLRVLAAEGTGGGGVITLTVTVENRGDAGAAAFWVDAWVDREVEWDGAGDDFVMVDWVGPDGTAQVELTVYPDTGGAHTVTISADTNYAVDEADEGNNTFSTEVSSGSGDTTTTTWGGGDTGW